MPDPYFSELKFIGGGSVDFIEVAVDEGLDVSNISVVVYNPNGTVRSTDPLGTVDGTIAGRDVYVIDRATAADFNGIHKNGAVALVENGVVLSFLSFDTTLTATNGPASGLTSTALGTTSSGESLETSDDGATYTVQTSPNPGTVPCFQAGSLILTDRGYRAVEDLKTGDLVATVDDGMQPLIWSGKRALTLAEMGTPALRPICIPAGSLARDVPNRDLYLSPNHRVALSHPMCALFFHEPEILAPAKALVRHRGIGHRPIGKPVIYHHLLFAAHQVIWANGLPSESFYPDALGLNAYPFEMVEELLACVPHLKSGITRYGPTARLVLKPDEARMLLSGAGTDPLALPYDHGLRVVA